MIYSLTKTYADTATQKLALWVADMMGAACDQAVELHISSEAIVGQVALESDWGRAAIGHNVAGIKADSSWTGPRILQRTAEEDASGNVYYINAYFRDYPSFKACLDDRLQVLKKNPAFAAAGVFTARSDLEYFQALKRGGYATDVDYVAKLVKMADSVRLFSASMVTSATAPAIASAPPAPRLLLIGMHGGDVEAVQTALTAQFFYRDRIDGDFGTKTHDAVIACQRVHHLDPDGMVGADTRTALGL